MKTAIYARVSDDRFGQGGGVARQIEDALVLAKARGFEVVEQYVDNDRSAFSGRSRPRWERMLADLFATYVARDEFELAER